MTGGMIDREQIQSAERLIRPYIRRTPVLEVRGSELDIDAGAVVFKLELFQHSGSFKTRGAFANLLMRDVPQAGVVAASGGNHGAAVAYAAKQLGKPARIFVPTVASPTGPFRRAIDHGVTGFLADGIDEWRSALDKLVGDPELRAAVGRAARDAVLFSHGPDRRAQHIKAVLDQVLDNGAGAAEAFVSEIARRQPRTPAAPPLAPVRTVFSHDRMRPSRVTVVVPVYNYASTVVEALDSVKAQTLEDLDLIVVEDASPDDSLAVITAWAEQNADRFNRLIVFSHVDNAGLACTRNRGFEEAEAGFTGTQAENFDTRDGLLCGNFRPQRLLVKLCHLIQVVSVKIPRAQA